MGSVIMGIFDQWRQSVKKAKKRNTLSVNKAKGKTAESVFEGMQSMMGNEVKRAPHGRDYIVTHRHPITRKYQGTIHYEVKSSQTAPMSPFQIAEKKRLGRRYKVYRFGF